MNKPTYSIQKGIDRPIEYKGLKGQYVIYAAAALVGLLIAYAILHLAKVPPAANLLITGAAAAALFYRITSLNKNYTRHGLLKKLAAKRIPRSIRSDSRKPFQRPAAKN